MDYQAEHLDQLPPDLRRQFDSLEKRLWRVDTVIAVAGALCGLFVSYALVFISDRFWDTPAWLRLLCTGAGIGILVFFTHGWLKHWVFKRRDTRALANLVQKQHRRLGDRLLGIVELANASKRPENVSPALCRAAIAQVSAEAIKCDFRVAVATRKPKIYCLSALFLFILLAAPFILTPEAGANALFRWMWPMKGPSRYTFVSVSDLPDRMVVPHGEPFEVEFGVTPRSFWNPATARCQYDQQPVIETPIKGKRALFKVPAQTQNGVLQLSVGDVSRRIAVFPTFRPQLKQLMAGVQPPDYLRYPSSDVEVRNGHLGAVEGSRVVLRGTTTRLLTSANMGGTETVSVPVSQSGFVSPQMALTNESQLTFAWKDNLGLTGKTPQPIFLTAQKDAPPQVELPDQPRQVAILENEVLPIRMMSQDDFGVQDMSITLEYVLPKASSEEPERASRVISKGGYQERKIEGKYEFSPELMQMPAGTLISVKASARDYFPGRVPVDSAVYRIFVLSKEEHAKLIQEQFERIRAAIEEMARKQENLVGDTKQTKDMPPDKQAGEEATKQLGEQSAEQQDYARQMERLAQEGVKTLKEASRNKAIPDKMVKDWAQNVSEMQKISDSEMQPASESLKSAQQSQNQSQRSEQTKKGLEKEEQALSSLQDLQKKMSSNLDQLQARGLAIRLRKVAGTEKSVGETLQKSLPQTIGLTKDQLPPDARKTLASLSTDQEKAGKETRKLTDEIERFHQRTSDEKHGEVAKEMKETQVADELGLISEMIKDNVAAQALHQAQNWSKKIEEWADKLDDKGKEEESEKDGKGKPEEANEKDMEKLMALLRLRDDEENLSDQTRLLEEQRAKRRNFAKDAERLTSHQAGIREELTELMQERIFGKVRPRLVQAGKAMTDAETLLTKPDTGEPTVSAETDAVNLMDDALQAILKGGQNKSKGGQAMEQMMAMTKARRAGGNPSQSASDRANSGINGDTGGKPGIARNPDRVSGNKTRVLPAEFREALQNYFNAVEQPKE